MFSIFSPKNSIGPTFDPSGSESGDGGSDVEIALPTLDDNAPPLEKDDKGKYSFPIARAVAAAGGTVTLAALAMALLAAAPAMAGDCIGLLTRTEANTFCLRLTDGGEPRADLIGTKISMVRLNGGMLTMVGQHTRTVPDNRRINIIYNSKSAIGVIAAAGSSIKTIESNDAVRRHLRIK